jgi:hypothetical protein
MYASHTRERAGRPRTTLQRGCNDGGATRRRVGTRRDRAARRACKPSSPFDGSSGSTPGASTPLATLAPWGPIVPCDARLTRLYGARAFVRGSASRSSRRLTRLVCESANRGSVGGTRAPTSACRVKGREDIPAPEWSESGGRTARGTISNGVLAPSIHADRRTRSGAAVRPRDPACVLARRPTA